MPHILVHHEVEDFSAWKAVFDEHKPARDAAGFTQLHLLRGAENPNDVVILFEVADLARARELTASEDLKESMARSGVIGKPELLELE